MKRQFIAVVAMLILLISGSALAQEKPPMDLPVYPGGESTMEINLTNEDILPMIKAVLPLMGDKLGKLADEVSAEDISDVLKDIKRIEFLQMEVYKTDVSESNITDFYVKNLPDGKWNRIFLQSSAPKGTMAIYFQPGAETLYGYRVSTVKQDSKMIKRIEVLKTEGKIDYVKLINLAGKCIKLPADVNK
jgi:hypothetical protein